jgi:hypothetical protein
MKTHEDHEIAGLKLRIGQIPPFQAYPLSNRVALILAPALNELNEDSASLVEIARAIIAEDINKILAALDVGTLATALGAALEKMQGADAQRLMLDAFLCTSVVRDGKKYDLCHGETAINAAFEGRGALVMQRALALAVRVNFVDFGAAAPAPDATDGAAKATT